MPTLHLVSTKECMFRGKPERFSNGYNFQAGSNPITAEFVEDALDFIVAKERPLHGPTVRFVYQVGGELGVDAVFSREQGTSGPLGTGPTATEHPEVCVMAESKMAPRVYLRSFYHTLGEEADGQGEPDRLNATRRGALTPLLAWMTDGTMTGGMIRCDPQGNLATAPFTADEFLRTRQFKRRGRRPTPSG